MADEVSCEMAESNLGVHKFSDQLLDQTINFQVLKMTNSLFLWIGAAAEMANLAVAMCTKYVSLFLVLVPQVSQATTGHATICLQEESVPAVSSLLGSTADISSSTLAQRLAKRTGKQCFVSYNVPSENVLLGLVENRINQEITEKPEKF